MVRFRRSLLFALLAMACGLPALAEPPRPPVFLESYGGGVSGTEPSWRWRPADHSPATTRYFVWPEWMHFGFIITDSSWRASDAPDGVWKVGIAAGNDQGEWGEPVVDVVKIVRPPAAPEIINPYNLRPTPNPSWSWRPSPRGGAPTQYHVRPSWTQDFMTEATSWAPPSVPEGIQKIEVMAYNEKGWSPEVEDLVKVSRAPAPTPTAPPPPDPGGWNNPPAGPPVPPPPSAQPAQKPGRPVFTTSYSWFGTSGPRPTWRWAPGRGGAPARYVIKVSWLRELIVTTETEYTADQDLPAGQLYTIEVRAENEAGRGKSAMDGVMVADR